MYVINCGVDLVVDVEYPGDLRILCELPHLPRKYCAGGLVVSLSPELKHEKMPENAKFGKTTFCVTLLMLRS